MDINVKEIIEGWKNLITGDLDSEPVAKERMLICSACDELSKKYVCKKCGCYMPAKTRSGASKCALGKW